jgi:REP element-mobilizing transposase RayT
VTRGLKRYYGHGDLHYITCSCFRRRPLLASREARDFFLSVFEQVRRRYIFDVIAYVVMPEHFHLLVSEPERGDPSVVMKVLKQTVSLSCFRRTALVSGSRDFMTSTSSPSKSGTRRLTTYTTIQWRAAWSPLRTNGAGAAIGPMRLAGCPTHRGVRCVGKILVLEVESIMLSRDTRTQTLLRPRRPPVHHM